VRITYPAHPHFGVRVPVWRRYRDGGERVVVELPGGYRQILPVEWTDERPSLSCPRIAKRLVLLDVRQLVLAAAFVAEKLPPPIAGSESRHAEAQGHHANGSDVLRRGAGGDRSAARAERGGARRGPALAGGGRAKGRAQRRRKR
jgi:hypothetical protein